LNIRRQYSLPNCIITLDGLDATGGLGEGDRRPCLSVLLNAELKFPAAGQAFQCDREFFETFARTVSFYAQFLLSGVRSPHLPPPSPAASALPPVQLVPLPNDRHRLTVQPPHLEEGTRPPLPVEVDLSVIELFDLVETLDQFYGDDRTLPDVQLYLEPVPKLASGKAGAPNQQIVPAIAGISAVALVAGAMLLPPVPQVQQPRDRVREQIEGDGEQNGSPTAPANGDAAPNAGPTPRPEPTVTPLESSPVPTPTVSPEVSPEATPEASPSPEGSPAQTSGEPRSIADPAQLLALSTSLRSQILGAWGDRDALDNAAAFDVSVGEDGAIIGYRPVDGTEASAAGDTPLSSLLFRPATPEPAPREALGAFRVVFRPGGVLEVSPRDGYGGDRLPEPPALDDLSSAQTALRQQLERQPRQEFSDTNPMEFIVTATASGDIVDYRAVNSVARLRRDLSPLPAEPNRAAAIAKDASGKVTLAPVGRFRVFVYRDGSLNVEPL
jgi:hypothetical protein